MGAGTLRPGLTRRRRPATIPLHPASAARGDKRVLAKRASFRACEAAGFGTDKRQPFYLNTLGALLANASNSKGGTFYRCGTTVCLAYMVIVIASSLCLSGWVGLRMASALQRRTSPQCPGQPRPGDLCPSGHSRDSITHETNTTTGTKNGQDHTLFARLNSICTFLVVLLAPTVIQGYDSVRVDNDLKSPYGLNCW